MKISIRLIMVILLLVFAGGLAFGQMDMLPQLLRDLPPEFQEGIPPSMTYEEYRMLNRNVDFFTMFMSMFVPGYGFFQVEKPGLAGLIIGGRVLGYGMMGLAVGRQWNDFQDLGQLKEIPEADFNNFLINAFLFGGGIVLNGLGWAFDVIGAYHIAKQEKDFIIYKYGLKRSLEGKNEYAMIEYIRKLELQKGDRQARRDVKKSLYEYLTVYPFGEFAAEAEYYLAGLLYSRGKKTKALLHAARGVFLYPENRFSEALRRLGVQIVQQNRARWQEDEERLMRLAEIGAASEDGQHEEQYFTFISELAELSGNELAELFPSEAVRFLNLFPESGYNGRLLFMLGDFYAEQGMWEEAVIEYIKTAALYPEAEPAPEALLRSADILDGKLNRGTYAEHYYRALIEKYPASDEAETARERVEPKNK